MTSITGIILALSLMIIMFGMGLSLVVADFKRIVTYPKAVLVGLFSQIIVLPFIGYLIASNLDLSPTIAISVMLLAACPGGATSNLLTHLAKGDLALSITLTAIASLLSIITIPFIVQFALTHFGNETQEVTLDAITTIKQLLVIVIIPVAIGMLIKAKYSIFADKMEKPVKTASTVIFILVVLGVVFSIVVTFNIIEGKPASHK